MNNLIKNFVNESKLVINLLFMKQCPNCSYKLVLLSTGPKDKCSLCNKIYPQKQQEGGLYY